MGGRLGVIIPGLATADCDRTITALAGLNACAYIRRRTLRCHAFIPCLRMGMVILGTKAPSYRASRTRSEESRVGKECVSTCRLRWLPYLKKKKINFEQQSLTAVKLEKKKT